MRRNETRLAEPPSKGNLPLDHYFPYATLPSLQSHIRPPSSFVIINLIGKVITFEQKMKMSIPALKRLFRIH